MPEASRVLSAEAVSYTHLDVYKRQVYEGAGAVAVSLILMEAVADVPVICLLYTSRCV